MPRPQSPSSSSRKTLTRYRLLLAAFLLFASTAQQYNVPFKHAAAVGGCGTPSATIKYWWVTDTGNITQDFGVTTWTDEQAALDLVQTTDSKEPTLSSSYLNGLDAVLFDGTADFMSTTSFTELSAPTTIFGIFKATTSNSSDGFMDGIASGKRRLIYNTGGVFMGFSGGNGNSGYTWDNAAHYFVWVFGDPEHEVYIDGSLTGSDSGSGNDGMTGVSLGAWYDQSNHSGVAWIEYGVVEGVISSGDRADMHTYLACRSGI